MKNTITLLLIILICFECNSQDKDMPPPDPFNIMKWYWSGFPKNYEGWAIDVEEIFYMHGWTEGYKLDRLNAYCDTCDYLDKYSFDIFLDYGNSPKYELSVEQNRDTTDKYMSLKYPEYFPPDTTPAIKDKIKMQPRWRDSLVGVAGGVTTGTLFLDSIRLGGTLTQNTVIDISKLETPNDTTKVIMLVADTSSRDGFRSSRCFWMYGYRVDKNYGMDVISIDGNGIATIPDPPYLDDRHLPLPKNVVVFLSKELK